jgi:hypothetical protein
LPCQCSSAKRTPRKRAVPKVTAPDVQESVEPVVFEHMPVQRQSMLERMRARAAQAPVTPIVPPPGVRAKPTARSAELSPEDQQELTAIRLLQSKLGATFIDPADEQRWKQHLNKPVPQEDRAAAWKARRRNATEGGVGSAQ